MESGERMTLKEAAAGSKYIVEKISTGDRELEAFLFSLGCYSGEEITVISQGRHGCIVAIKDGRYSMDNALSQAIEVL